MEKVPIQEGLALGLVVSYNDLISALNSISGKSGNKMERGSQAAIV